MQINCPLLFAFPTIFDAEIPHGCLGSFDLSCRKLGALKQVCLHMVFVLKGGKLWKWVIIELCL